MHEQTIAYGAVSPGRNSGRVLRSSHARSRSGRSMPMTRRSAVPLASEIPAGVSAAVIGRPSSLTDIQSSGLSTTSSSVPASALAEALSSSIVPSAEIRKTASSGAPTSARSLPSLSRRARLATLVRREEGTARAQSRSPATIARARAPYSSQLSQTPPAEPAITRARSACSRRLHVVRGTGRRCGCERRRAP